MNSIELVSKPGLPRVEPLSDSGAILHFPDGLADLTNPDSPYGHAYLGSLSLLAVEHTVGASSLTAHGTSRSVVAAIPQLQEGLQELAKAGSSRAEVGVQDYYRMLSQLLNRVTGELSTNIGPSMRFPNTMLAITGPFADYQRTTGSRRPFSGEPAGEEAPNPTEIILRSRPLHRPSESNVLGATH
ncbi:hypothetical protein EYC59_00625 [Candidatus Saccharibacteria bacterium]|nr:MAG: hypothetical protein EYC59_00625 [Candidatus Saccharibacteria bacterium]